MLQILPRVAVHELVVESHGYPRMVRLLAPTRPPPPSPWPYAAPVLKLRILSQDALAVVKIAAAGGSYANSTEIGTRVRVECGRGGVRAFTQAGSEREVGIASLVVVWGVGLCRWQLF